MDPAVAMDPPLCTWNNETGILTVPQDNQIDGILSDARSLPFFREVLVVTRAVEVSKSGKKNQHIAPEMCFKLGVNCRVQSIHRENNRKKAKTTEPGAAPGIGTQASAATPATADQLIIELDQTNDSFSKEESDKESDDESSSGSSSLLTSSDEDGQASQPAGSR